MYHVTIKTYWKICSSIFYWLQKKILMSLVGNGFNQQLFHTIRFAQLWMYYWFCSWRSVPQYRKQQVCWVDKIKPTLWFCVSAINFLFNGDREFCHTATIMTYFYLSPLYYFMSIDKNFTFFILCNLLENFFYFRTQYTVSMYAHLMQA